MNRWSVGCLLAVLSWMAVGCGPSGHVEVYPVKGTVKFDGSPMMGGGSIALIPVGNQAGAAAGGEIKEDGTYELWTYAPGDGSMAGEFKVAIIQSVHKEPQATPDGSKPAAAVPAPVPEAKRIPPIYSNTKDTPLKIKVEAKPNEINLDLKRN